MTREKKKTRIAVLGGGLGSLSTVFALTEQEAVREQYDITVYQMGWRLGGKGASGRNGEKHERIEEHGLHIWMGCYNNGFYMAQRCYEECKKHNLLPADCPFQEWTDAFKQHSLVTLMDQFRGQWYPWTSTFQTNDATPGTGDQWLSPQQHLNELIKWLLSHFEAAEHEVIQAFRKTHHQDTPAGWVEKIWRQVVEDARTTVGDAKHIMHDTSSFFQRAQHMLESLSDDPTRHSTEHYHAVAWLLKEFRKKLAEQIEGHDDIGLDLHRLWILIDVGIAVALGVLREATEIFRNGWGALDKYDFKEWLLGNLASEENAWSAPIQGVYDLVFAYENGDSARPNLAAGVAMRIFSRVAFGYKGAISYKMQAGMGDTVFSPLYKLLQYRGVKFRFFNRVQDLKLSQDKKRVEEIHIGVQATLKEQAKKNNVNGEYAPLRNVNQLPCWPSNPLYDQLEQGDELRRGKIDLESAWTPWKNPDPNPTILQLGRDFDQVVLGISLAAIKNVGAELVDHSRAWTNLVSNVKTVQTEAYQLWMNHDSAEMGWHGCEPNIWSAYQASGADMSDLIPKEDWPESYQVRNITYYVKQFKDADHIPDPGPDPSFPDSQLTRVKENAIQFLNHKIQPLWPGATDPHNPEGINWDWVVDPEGHSGSDRLAYQYCRANVSPTERYVLSVKNSTQYRLTSETCEYDNLFIAGDWTVNAFNAGCVEAAVSSGFMASRAISGYPSHIEGETDVNTRASATLIPKTDCRSLSHSPAEPQFVNRGGAQTFPQPLRLEGCRFYSFILDADKVALQQLCDRYLNAPANGQIEYRPLVSAAVLGVAETKKISCIDLPPDQQFWIPETDIAFWVPVVKGVRSGSVFTAQSLQWFMPYVFVDNPWAVASGREIYGFPKETSRFQLPSQDNPDLFTVDTMTVREFSPSAEATWQRLIQISRQNNPANDPFATTFQTLTEGGKAFLRELVGEREILLPNFPSLLEELYNLVVHGRMPLVFLKQFRSATDGNKSCYTGVVEAPAEIKAFRKIGRLNAPYSVEIQPFASHPIVEELGLQGTGDAPWRAQSESSWFVDFDFDLLNASAIWQR